MFTYENVDVDGKCCDVIEIVSSDSELGVLKKSGNKNLKISLPLCLCIGKLNGINNYNRNELKRFMNSKQVRLFKNDFNFKYEIDNLLLYAKTASKIRIWSSHLNCDDYCLLLYLCYILKDKNISVVYSEELDWHATTLGGVSQGEIKYLEQKEHILKNWEKEEFSNEWLKVINDNSELRYMINGQVISCNIDYFDKDILQRLKN